MSMEGAVEEYPWGHVAWKVRGKLFAIGTASEGRVTVRSTLEKQAALIMHPNIEVASHVGRFGWVTIEISDRETLDLTLSLIDESYASIASGGKRRR